MADSSLSYCPDTAFRLLSELKCCSHWEELDAQVHLGMFYQKEPSGYEIILRKAGLPVRSGTVLPQYDYSLDIDREKMNVVCEVLGGPWPASSRDRDDMDGRLSTTEKEHKEDDLEEQLQFSSSTSSSCWPKPIFRMMVNIWLNLVEYVDLLRDFINQAKTVNEPCAYTCASMFRFVSVFANMLQHCCFEGIKPDKTLFENLFKDFAAIFYVFFETVGSRSKENTSVTATLFKNWIGDVLVTSFPDLILTDTLKMTDWFDTAFAFTKKEFKPISVVTFGEVKRTCKSKEVDTWSKDTNDREESPPSRQEISDVMFPSTLRGQHAVQLLFLRSHTRSGNCVLGLVVQATKVRLTCLEMDEEHLQEFKFEAKERKPLKIKRRSYIYYTRAYDMFIKKERDILSHILTSIALSAHNNLVPGVPTRRI